MENLVEVRLTLPQVKLIESIVAIPTNLEQSLKQAVKAAKGASLQIPYDRLDQLAGWLAAEANYEERARRKRALDRLYDEVQTALWDFEDQFIAKTALPPASGGLTCLHALQTSSGTKKKTGRTK